ncbi:MAG: hypothetical protein Athens101410_148 [Parcubacteria group bacterium Athens1014_10]|nr:MAG: hypothetical protein Athens101410_148 [Parcubacteria group bacterium Athens1014_10]TSD05883.1 MAG: hypothetical protein Athens071412_165 [Parcubacteria group bacterium Athens0714_12]
MDRTQVSGTCDEGSIPSRGIERKIAMKNLLKNLFLNLQLNKMLEKILRFLEKYIIPRFIFKWGQPIYHSFLSFSAGLCYGFPSRKMIVIGVTGTGGKSTVVNLIAKVLEEAGFKVGLTSTMNFKINKKEWLNKTKMTMLGRFALQKLLKEMVKAGCQYAILETSSEGIRQYRHLNIDYDIAVLTNLTPEHIESHGGFENYKKTKGKLFQNLTNYKRKQIMIKGEKTKIKKISVINLDDENADYFLRFEADEKNGYGINFQFSIFPEGEPLAPYGAGNFQTNLKSRKINRVRAEKISLTKNRSNFFVNGIEFNLKLLGEFNICNALAAASTCLSQGINLETIKVALEKVESFPGRMEEIKQGQNFRVFIDYAHTPDSLEKVYQMVSGKEFKNKDSKIISVFGSAGGGRDKSKRPILGELAAKYSDYIIITNEDPYDEDPLEIMGQISQGVKKDFQKKEGFNFWQILDRKEAIKKALLLAKPNDIVLITGKGSEQCIMGPKGERIPWNDYLIVKELLA